MSSTTFLDLYLSRHPDCGLDRAELLHSWLHSPGLPAALPGLNILDLSSNSLYREVGEAFR